MEVSAVVGVEDCVETVSESPPLRPGLNLASGSAQGAQGEPDETTADTPGEEAAYGTPTVVGIEPVLALFQSPSQLEGLCWEGEVEWWGRAEMVTENPHDLQKLCDILSASEKRALQATP